MSGIDVSIIIVSYNTCAMTKAAIDAVAAETRGVGYELLVVDNASRDGSAEMLAAHPAKPHLFLRQDNLGFARANTFAARHAQGRYLLLLNPDTVVLDRAIDKLVAFARTTPDAGIWGGRTLFGDGRLNPSSCWHRMTLWNQLCRCTGLTALGRNTELFNGEAFGGWARNSVRQVDIVSGCFLLIEKALWDKLGGFDPLFFMYGEEADLCLRAAQLGARPVVTPEATIIHYGGASEKARTEKMIRLLAAKASLINRHWRPASAPLGRALLAAWPASRAIATAMKAALMRDAAALEAADVWRQIWVRRAEWRHGYEAAPLSTAPAAAASPGGAP